MDVLTLKEKIFLVETEEQFNEVALEVFRFQYLENPIYRTFCAAVGCDPDKVIDYMKIPCMPVEFFRYHRIISNNCKGEVVFASSGTTGQNASYHHVCDIDIYETSFLKSFQMLVGKPSDFHILALLPSYLERGNSSLVYMANRLIEESRSEHSGFYLNNLSELKSKIQLLGISNRKILLIGVSFALLDMAEKFPVRGKDMIVMETGGMKGRRKELLREELHEILKKAFGVEKIYSEYGMTELLSQAYSDGNGIFKTPPWMKVLIRDANDPISFATSGRSGTISVIDLANLYSCSFLNTRDVGREISENQFLILGRMDHSDVRGCNLMVE
jgi:phenylacetate-coenzyme A ligase PaaK-like adenylate-forming protein